MAVKAVTERRQISINISEGTGTRYFRVEFEDADYLLDYPDKVALAKYGIDPNTALRIPRKNEILSATFSNIVVDQVTAKIYSEQNNLWDVDVSYIHIDDKDNEDEKESDIYPWDEPWDFSYSSSTSRFQVFSDKDGKPNLNSAGDPFETGVEVDRYLRVLTLRRKSEIANFHPITAADSLGTVNQASFTWDIYTIPALFGKLLQWDGVKLTKIVTQNDIEETVEYWDEVVQVLYDPWTHIVGILDQGRLENAVQAPFNANANAGVPRFYADGHPQGPRAALNKKGGKINGIFTLNGFGERLKLDDGTFNPVKNLPGQINPNHTPESIDLNRSSQVAIFLSSHILDEIDFSILNADGAP